MPTTSDFIAKARANADAERAVLEHTIAIERTQRWFSRSGGGFKTYLMEFLTELMAQFWLKVAPILVFCTLILVGLASFLGISFTAALGVVIVIAVALIAFVQSFK